MSYINASVMFYFLTFYLQYR